MKSTKNTVVKYFITHLLRIALVAFTCATALATAGTVESKLYSTGAHHQYLGKIIFTDSNDGLLIEPNLNHIPPGPHGLHIHEKAMCTDHGKAAGGHLDPYHTGKHLGPYQSGHLGDLPVLRANAKGNANQVTIAPRLTAKDIINHSVILHQGGDNYRDHPKPLGGGGARIACGVITPSD